MKMTVLNKKVTQFLDNQISRFFFLKLNFPIHRKLKLQTKNVCTFARIKTSTVTCLLRRVPRSLIKCYLCPIFLKLCYTFKSTVCISQWDCKVQVSQILKKILLFTQTTKNYTPYFIDIKLMKFIVTFCSDRLHLSYLFTFL